MTGTGKSHPSKKPAQRRASRFEFSAGGIVRDGDKVLMIKVENMEGHQLWTFPKGHIEQGESAEQAALREVEEETGYQCDVVEPLEKVAYWFERNGVLTRKTVVWFLMKSVAKTGEHDPEEILGTEWVSISDAAQRVRYKSDKKIMNWIGSKGDGERGGKGIPPSPPPPLTPS
jgi:8-oxo-dGTP pyrophosphatase MutT (NUDIX family)